MDNKNIYTEIRDKLFIRFGIETSRKWTERYVFLFSHCIPNNNRSVKETLFDINSNDTNMLIFAYFIHGHRAEYHAKFLNHKSE